MPFFENEGARLHYEVTGGGRPLIFLHGFGCDMRMWKNEVKRFSSRYRVIALDARGHGQSTLPPGEVAPGVFWRDVVALMDVLELEKAVLCGLSMGGHVAIQTAINAGERVEGLLLLGAICTNQFNGYERWAVPVNRFCQRLMPMSWIASSVAMAMGRHNPAAKLYIREVIKSMPHDVYNRTWKAVSSMESREGLTKISCPALLLIGEHDNMTGRQQQYMQEHIQGARLAGIPKAGHGTNLDNPGAVAREIEGFLTAIKYI